MWWLGVTLYCIPSAIVVKYKVQETLKKTEEIIKFVKFEKSLNVKLRQSQSSLEDHSNVGIVVADFSILSTSRRLH